jgi:hypothetical protein
MVLLPRTLARWLVVIPILSLGLACLRVAPLEAGLLVLCGAVCFRKAWALKRAISIETDGRLNLPDTIAMMMLYVGVTTGAFLILLSMIYMCMYTEMHIIE